VHPAGFGAAFSGTCPLTGTALATFTITATNCTFVEVSARLQPTGGGGNFCVTTTTNGLTPGVTGNLSVGGLGSQTLTVQPSGNEWGNGNTHGTPIVMGLSCT
jgi:hypothetical protein